MVIAREDCISIADATFDLTLEDSSPMKTFPPTDILPDHQAQDDMSFTAVDAEVDIDHETEILKHFKLGSSQLCMRHSDDKNDENAEYDELIVRNLKKSISKLSKACGNNNIPLEDNLQNYNSKNEEIKNLSMILMKLSENTALKLNFYENNYKFVEGLHEASDKENQVLKQKIEYKARESDELSKKYEALKKDHLQYLNFKDPTDSKSPPQQQPSRRQQEPPNYETESQMIIMKQQKEIKEYKRFIKELMERE